MLHILIKQNHVHVLQMVEKKKRVEINETTT